MVIDFISCAVRREGLGILKSTGRQPSPIGGDTESKVYASNVRGKGLREVFVGSTTGWHRNGIMKELLVEFRRLEREAREQRKGLYRLSTERP